MILVLSKLDFAISCIPEFHKDLTKVFLYNDPFCVAFYKGHHFQNMKEVPIDEIRKEPNYIFRRTCEFFYYIYKLTNKGKTDYKIINNKNINLPSILSIFSPSTYIHKQLKAK